MKADDGKDSLFLPPMTSTVSHSILGKKLFGFFIQSVVPVLTFELPHWSAKEAFKLLDKSAVTHMGQPTTEKRWGSLTVWVTLG